MNAITSPMNPMKKMERSDHARYHAGPRPRTFERAAHVSQFHRRIHVGFFRERISAGAQSGIRADRSVRGHLRVSRGHATRVMEQEPGTRWALEGDVPRS